MVLRANEKGTRGVRESAKAADRFASCREERMREGDAFPLERGLQSFFGGGEELLFGYFWVESEDVASWEEKNQGIE